MQNIGMEPPDFEDPVIKAIMLDENTLQVDKVIPESIQTVTYDYDFLIEQRDRIQAQKDSDNAMRDAELEEVNGLIAQCENLGLKSKMGEETINAVR